MSNVKGIFYHSETIEKTTNGETIFWKAHAPRTPEGLLLVVPSKMKHTQVNTQKRTHEHVHAGAVVHPKAMFCIDRDLCFPKKEDPQAIFSVVLLFTPHFCSAGQLARAGSFSTRKNTCGDSCRPSCSTCRWAVRTSAWFE